VELFVAFVLVAVEFEVYVVVSEAGTGIYYEVIGIGVR